MNNSDNTFNGLGIAPKLMEILARQKFHTPTPIQKQSIPVGISGKDLIGIAQTGTGKTLAFGIPMLQRLVITKSKGLVLVPTRELAVQVNESLKQIGKPLGLKTAVIIGGEAMGRQISALRQNPHIVIATPGRLIDILDQRKIDLTKTEVLVLDEADRMLDMGFEPQLRRIMPHLPQNRQTMLFSATMDQEVTNIAAAILKLPTRIEVAPAGTTAAQVTQEIIVLARDEKISTLKKTLEEYKGSTLIFCRTKHGARKIAQMLKHSGLTAAEIHSNRSLNQRLEALQGFKMGKYRVLVATDIAARGIDVTNIELVINYDLPENAADYVHRIGRTARAGKSGHAISFATTDQRSDIRAIERLIKKTLPVKKSSGTKDLPEDFIENRSFSKPRNSRGGFGRRSGFQSRDRNDKRPDGRRNEGRRENRFSRGNDRKKSRMPEFRSRPGTPQDQGFRTIM